MHIPKNYFHDRLVLFLLSINTFLALGGSLLVFLRLDTGQTNSLITQYRSEQLSVNTFQNGSPGDLLLFILFMLLVWIFHTMFSMKVYHLRKHLSTTILFMGTILLLVAAIVSNALLDLQ